MRILSSNIFSPNLTSINSAIIAAEAAKKDSNIGTKMTAPNVPQIIPAKVPSINLSLLLLFYCPFLWIFYL